METDARLEYHRKLLTARSTFHLVIMFSTIARLFVLIGLCGSLASAVAAEPQKFEPLDVFQLEYATEPQISPDARQVVYVRKSMDIMRDRRVGRLWVVNTNGTAHRKLTSTDADESSPRWSPDGTRIAYVTEGLDGNEITLLWLDTGQQARLTQLEASPSSLEWSPDGKSIAFSMFVAGKPEKLVDEPTKPKGAQWADPPRVITMLKHEDDGKGQRKPGYHQLFVVPADGGTARQITDGEFHHRGPTSWMPDGESLLFSANRSPEWEYEYRNSEVYRVSVVDGSIQQLTDRNGPDHSPVVSPDGKTIAYLGYDDKMQTYQTTNLYLMDADGGNPRWQKQTLDRDLRDIRWHANSRDVYFLYENHGELLLGTDSLSGESHVKIANDVGGATVGSPSNRGSYTTSVDGSIAYTKASEDRPADVVFRAKGGEVRQLTDLNADLLNHRQLGKKEEIWFESSFDGRKIQGWIVTPPDFDSGKKYPLMLLIHGGPISNYGRWFGADVQLSAAAGYVVLYTNPRGSTGYGAEFGNLLYHDFPGHDYDDMMSAVDVVIERGFIDTDQLYVTGGSAGGTSTAWIVGNTDRFRAAVVVKPVINWLSKTLIADNYYAYHNNRYPGLPWENPEGYLRDSPIVLASNIKTPTMLMVGTDDLRTPPSEAKQLYHALKLRKVETALVEIPGASHGIVIRPSQLITKVAHTLAWFEKHAPAETTVATEESSDE